MFSNGGWMSQEDIALLTDLYELRMLQSYWETGMHGRAVFSLHFRELPPERNFILACGQTEVIRHLERLSFEEEHLKALHSLGGFKDEFLTWLRDFRFTGDVHAVPEGTPIFPHEPILEVEAPIAEAQLLESFVMNQVHLQSLLASKAVRTVLAAEGRGVVDFGLRRMHGADAALRGVRAYWIAGLDATSNVLGGLHYQVPVAGTMAHSYIQAHQDEDAAFEHFLRLYPGTILLVDTYDTLEGVRKVIELAKRSSTEGLISGIRLDSGDLSSLSKQARLLLDEAGLDDIKIFVSGGLNEFKIAQLVEGGAPIDSFGVGTDVGCSKDSPMIDLVYKLTEYDGEGRTKASPGKHILPGRKQVYRHYDTDGRIDFDRLTLRDEADSGTPLLQPVMKDGQVVDDMRLERLDQARDYCRREVQALPDSVKRLSSLGVSAGIEVRLSDKLKAFDEAVLKKI
ncbi:nicotinate phosphoribosyltransferase [Saccharospirillum salsuginis]|uniref:Nicotinate phosphoribosyltransferase n=1 Tax=Saccharospirillum salsuginis TaxID=418750 RepID=A0A918NAC4_9GAMM|nr:nicotinate phosphoribosyltransferase [Saccharospirillum salsuginis]GGX53056.1 nicotinate phosphoribosyltransferase [Saccharospirillum salsuginis]